MVEQTEDERWKREGESEEARKLDEQRVSSRAIEEQAQFILT